MVTLRPVGRKVIQHGFFRDSDLDFPLLITDPEGEQFWPGQSSQLSGLVPGRADVLRFGADEGAAYHCQPTGRLLTENRMFDWLAEFVPARRA